MERILTELMSPDICIYRIALQVIARSDGVEHVLDLGAEIEGAPVPISTIMTNPINDIVIAINARVGSVCGGNVSICYGLRVTSCYSGADGEI